MPITTTKTGELGSHPTLSPSNPSSSYLWSCPSSSAPSSVSPSRKYNHSYNLRPTWRSESQVANAPVSTIYFYLPVSDSRDTHWSCTSPGTSTVLRAQEGLKQIFKPPSRSWVLHSFQSTYLIWSYFYLHNNSDILTNPNEESRELYLHCNYHVAQNGSPPLGRKLFLSLHLASSVFFYKTRPRGSLRIAKIHSKPKRRHI